MRRMYKAACASCDHSMQVHRAAAALDHNCNLPHSSLGCTCRYVEMSIGHAGMALCQSNCHSSVRQRQPRPGADTNSLPTRMRVQLPLQKTLIHGPCNSNARQEHTHSEETTPHSVSKRLTHQPRIQVRQPLLYTDTLQPDRQPCYPLLSPECNKHHAFCRSQERDGVRLTAGQPLLPPERQDTVCCVRRSRGATASA